MSIRSLADFMEESLRSERRLASTATVTGRRGPQVDASAKGADIWWPELRTSHGHRCGLFMAKSADFLVATDSIRKDLISKAKDQGVTVEEPTFDGDPANGAVQCRRVS